MRGLFVSVEGIDGAGKSTQLARLAAALRAEGHAVVETREPGGSPGAEAIRALVLGGEAGRWSAETELLLFTAARRDHLETVIAPALAAGRVVLCDRFADSTRVYQGLAGPEALARVDRLHEMMIGVEPDLTLLFDLAPGAAAARMAARGQAADRMEHRGDGFRARLRAGFLALAAAHPARIRVIEAGGAPDVVAAAVRAAVAPLLAHG